MATERQVETAQYWLALMRRQLGPVPAPKRWRRRGYLTEKELQEIAAVESEQFYAEQQASR
jgi:hypothetical protein